LIMKSYGLLIAATSLGLTLGGTHVSAAPTTAPPVAQISTNQLSPVELAVAHSLEAAKPFMVRRADGTMSFDATAAVRAGVNMGHVAELASGISAANRDIAAHPSVVGADSATVQQEFAACAGRNRYISHWYGPELWLNSCNARTIVGLLAGGASIGSITGAIVALTGIGIPATALIALAVGMIGLGAAAISFCNRDSTGVKIYKPIVGSLFFCTRQ
jgi:hypothetical protein